MENDIALKRKCLGSTGVIITKAEVPANDAADICDNCLSNFILWWKEPALAAITNDEKL